MIKTMMSAGKVAVAVMAIVLVFTSGAELVPAGGDLVVAPAEAFWGLVSWIPLPHFKKSVSDVNGTTVCEGFGVSCIVWN